MPRRLLAVPLLLLLAPACAVHAPRNTVLSHYGSRVRLTLPASWPADAVVTSARRGAAAGHPGAEYTLEVDYRPLEAGLPRVPLLQLVVFPADRQPTGPGEVLVEAASRIYVLVLPRDRPYPAGTRDADRLDSMRPTLHDIRKGLVITQGED